MGKIETYEPPQALETPPEFQASRRLTPLERSIMQLRADGLVQPKIEMLLDIDENMYQKTVNHVRKKGVVEKVGFGYVKYHNPTVIFCKLIREGIMNGVLTHRLPEYNIQTLTPSENEIMKAQLDGAIPRELAISRFEPFTTIQAQITATNRKLGTVNHLHRVARYTYLQMQAQSGAV